MQFVDQLSMRSCAQNNQVTLSTKMIGYWKNDTTILTIYKFNEWIALKAISSHCRIAKSQYDV